jgi:hypothetical protein
MTTPKLTLLTEERGQWARDQIRQGFGLCVCGAEIVRCATTGSERLWPWEEHDEGHWRWERRSNLMRVDPGSPLPRYRLHRHDGQAAVEPCS